MKNVLLLITLFFTYQQAFSQISAAPDTSKIFHTVDQLPQFPAAYGSASNYIASRVIYPDSAIRHHVEGRVVIQFVVEADGAVSNAKVVKGIGYGCDTAALKVVREMPKWTPGEVNGNPARVYYMVPVTFKINETSLETALKDLRLNKDLPSPAKAPVDQAEEGTLVMPEFPGGQSALQRYLSSHLHYPSAARKARVEGVVYATFVIDDNGMVTDVQIMKGIGPACDKEAIRVLSHMPRWKPGSKNGKKVKVHYSLPIHFDL